MTNQVYIADYTHTLDRCCGVHEVGEFSYKSSDKWNSRKKIEDVEESGTGMFVCTFTKEDVCQDAYTALCKKHTLMYESPYLSNGSDSATSIGRDGGISLCVFKFGKE